MSLALTAALAEVRLQTPLTGSWGRPDFPDEVQVAQRRFRRAGWQQARPGVVAQYREAVPRMSHHLSVFEDGRWEIDHVDDFNPDMGHATKHFFNDYAPGKAAWALYSIFGIASVLYGASVLLHENRKRGCNGNSGNETLFGLRGLPRQKVHFRGHRGP